LWKRLRQEGCWKGKSDVGGVMQEELNMLRAELEDMEYVKGELHLVY
jgi:hypothetical protein